MVLAELGGIRWNLVEFSGTWRNSVELSGIWWNLAEYGGIWQIAVRLPQIAVRLPSRGQSLVVESVETGGCV